MSDLRTVERLLQEIVNKLSSGLFSSNPADNLQRMTHQLDEVVSLLKDVSRKLDKR
jgi:uncharacterized protein Yka (UPF0111/DUF47 family)